jgi:flagellin
MGLQINNNIPALGASRQANRANSLLADSLRKLGEGRRITRAADDAAGLAIAERFRTQVRQGSVEINNLQSGISAVQVADGGLQVQQDAVQRIRELAVQASNGTLSTDDRAALNAEAQQLLGQIEDVAQDTEFNGQNLLGANRTIDLGTEGGAQVEITGSTQSALGLNGVDLSTAEGASQALESLDGALGLLDQNRASLGAQQNRFESAINERETRNVNVADAESRIRDLDLARASIDQARANVLLRGSLGALVQANVTPQSTLRLLGA